MAGAPDASEASFDLTPMIDVILLLIIFFMLSSQFANSELRPVDLPAERGAPPPSESAAARLVVDMDRMGAFTVMGEPVEAEALAERVAAVQRGSGSRHSGVVVRADRAAPAAALNRLAERLAEAGVANWSIAVASEGEP
jgi:biopolymer transport protein ExbD